ncbi:MAG: DUF374 domain-containing protein [Rhodobacteraceae bacterium]|nr:DUF374 domain-containing protein [Paracoccaceae bacterium]
MNFKDLKRRWRRFEVRLQQSSRVQNALRSMISGYVNLVFRRIRWEWIGLEELDTDLSNGRPRVLSCWHSQLMFAPYLRDWTDHPLFILASRHADAQLATSNMEKMPGVSILTVGTSGDNSASIRDAVKRVRRGASMGIAVDGPMGPALIAKPGAVVIAGLAGVTVSPVAYAVTHKIRLGTWDRFVVPMPWGRGVLAVGEGFVPPRRMSEAEAQTAADRLGTMINDLAALCESRLQAKRRG